MHKILNANETVVKQDLPYITGDSINYYNFWESNSVWQNISKSSIIFILTDSVIMLLEIHPRKYYKISILINRMFTKSHLFWRNFETR